MSNKLIFATNNYNKVEEIKHIIGKNYEILTLKDIEYFDIIPENQNTLVGNALQKAKTIYDKYKINCFADDTGLEVKYLNGNPGVNSARFAGEEQNSDKNIIKLLNQMEDVIDRETVFRTVIALLFENKEYFFEGELKGIIANKPLGKNGFGYDSIFIPEGFNETFAEMPPDLKNKISHRYKAIEKLKVFLKDNIIT